MATIDLSADLTAISLRFDAAVPDVLLDCGTVALTGLGGGAQRSAGSLGTRRLSGAPDSALALQAHPETVMALLLPCHDQVQVGFVVQDRLLFAEPVRFSARVLQAGHDPLKLNCLRHPHPAKPARVAIFTQSFNEGRMLKFWENHHASLVGHEHLYVLDNGGTDGSCEALHPRTNRLHLPGGVMDHLHFAQMQSCFQRFLLQKYDWVVKTDTDEFLSVAQPLPALLAGVAPGIYMAERAIAVVHDHRSEPALDPTRPLGVQRQHFVHDYNIFRKPAVAAQPLTWTVGNHNAYEGCQPLPGTAMVHLHFADLAHHLNRNRRWAAMTQSARDAALTNSVDGLKALDEQGLVDAAIKGFDTKLAEARVTVPDQVLALCLDPRPTAQPLALPQAA